MPASATFQTYIYNYKYSIDCNGGDELLCGWNEVATYTTASTLINEISTLQLVVLHMLKEKLIGREADVKLHTYVYSYGNEDGGWQC